MADYEVTALPSGSTRTLTSEIDKIVLRSQTNRASNFSKSVSITNLDTAANLYVSFKDAAVAEDEELAILPGSSINIDVSRAAAFDIWVRGTAGKKYTYYVM